MRPHAIGNPGKELKHQQGYRLGHCYSLLERAPDVSFERLVRNTIMAAPDFLSAKKRSIGRL
jgi:hypothetical protein